MTTHAPAPRRSDEEQLRVDAAITDVFEQRITFNTVLGLKLLSVRPGDVRGRVAMKPELIGHYAYGRLHGGAISATLDTMGGLAVMVGLAERHAQDNAAQILQRFLRVSTIDLRIDYLRPGQGHHFIAAADVTRLGGRLGSTQMRLVNDEGTLIATGAASYVIS